MGVVTACAVLLHPGVYDFVCLFIICDCFGFDLYFVNCFV